MTQEEEPYKIKEEAITTPKTQTMTHLINYHLNISS